MNQRKHIDKLLRQSKSIEWVNCSECDYVHPVEPSQSPGIARETRCMRCLNAEISRLRRQVFAVLDTNPAWVTVKIKVPIIALSTLRIELECFKLRKLLQAAFTSKADGIPRPYEETRSGQAEALEVGDDTPPKGPRLGEEEAARSREILEAHAEHLKETDHLNE